MSVKNLDRETQALLSLHDHGTRDGATTKKVVQAMLNEGFTREEIAHAAAKMNDDT